MWATKREFGKCVTLWAVKGQVWQSPVVKGSQGLIEPAKSHRRDGWPQRCSLWQESQTISYFSRGRWCKLFLLYILDLPMPPAIKSALKNAFSCLPFFWKEGDGCSKNKSNRWNNKSKWRVKSGTFCFSLCWYSWKILLVFSHENSIVWINIFFGIICFPI